MDRLSLFAVLLTAAAMAASAVAAPVECACDAAEPATLTARQCGLCKAAEAQPADTKIFFLKDINPRKANRLLALPRPHTGGNHELHDMSPLDRTLLWTAAIDKAKELWGPAWGVAYNGAKVRTQCHTHIHIGKLLNGVEEGKFIVISKPSQIPARPGEGLWIHPAGNRMHVHIGEQTTETVLLR
ncbi:MAG: hypothetical protein ABJF23_06635 [Bryobacteraceae bacterium]